MKLISWNCQRGQKINEKLEKIVRLDPDIAIIQECPHPQKFQNTDIQDYVWAGKEEGLGIGVLSYSNDYNISILVDEVEYEWIVPIKVSGKAEFILIAVWTQRIPGYSSYGKLLFTALKEYENHFDNNHVMVIGDFNIDKKLPSSYTGIKRGKGFEEIIELLNRNGLESCYHYLNKEKFGSESKATYYHYKKKDRPFHIDYCFVSREILKHTKNFYIDEGEDWIQSSDHLPLVIEVEL
ncbi:MAG: endonuclease/exonuclease/phosphatase family protein [Bacillota bacterium]